MTDIGVIGMIIYVFASLLSSVFSGIVGGGGGFIMTPLLIFLGLTPAQSVSTGKFAGLAVSLGSIKGLRGVKVRNKKLFFGILLVSLIAGLIAPFVIKGLDSGLYKKILGIILLAMIPLVVYKKVGRAVTNPKKSKKIIGFGLVGLALSFQGAFSAGIGSFVTIFLMEFLGMDALEANLTKRYSQLILNISIVLGVIGSGLIYWPIVLIAIITAGYGGYLGGKIAINKGNNFVMNVFIVLMLVSGLALLFI